MIVFLNNSPYLRSVNSLNKVILQRRQVVTRLADRGFTKVVSSDL